MGPLYEYAWKLVFRLRLRPRDFTIVSNNCWGADIYAMAGMPYLTPFVGLFIKPDCYLKLLDDFRNIIKLPLKFKKESHNSGVNEFRKAEGLYPLGSIGDDIEINFLHYGSEEEAAEKWRRRVQRINADDDKLFVKFCDTDLPSDDQLRHFDGLLFANKVCFTGKYYEALKDIFVIPGFESTGHVENLQLIRTYRDFFDPAGWLNGGLGKPRQLKQVNEKVRVIP